jgi:hypothetical protein
MLSAVVVSSSKHPRYYLLYIEVFNFKRTVGRYIDRQLNKEKANMRRCVHLHADNTMAAKLHSSAWHYIICILQHSHATHLHEQCAH